MRNSLLVISILGCLSQPARAEKPKLEGVINLNTASAEELGLIPGVGPARIRNILAYRKAHPFRTVDELARIKGIGRKTVRQWRMHLAVGGPSTAQRVVRPEQPNAPAGSVREPPVVVRPAPRPVLAQRPGRQRGEPSRRSVIRAAGVHGLPPP